MYLIKTICLICLFLLQQSCATAESKIPGIWAEKCGSSRGGYSIDINDDGLYVFTFCAGTKCIGAPGIRSPVDIYADDRFKVVSDTEITINGKAIHQCQPFKKITIDAYATTSDIENHINARWRLTHIVSKGIERSGRTTWWSIKRNGNVAYPGGHTNKYVIDGSKLLITNSTSNKINKYNIVSVTPDKLMLETQSEKDKQTIFYKFDLATIRIDDSWLTNKAIFITHSSISDIYPRSKKHFSIELAGDYESTSCFANIFAPNGEYSEISTQACYRKKGEKEFHFDINNKYYEHFLKYGSWRIEDDIIYVTITATGYDNKDSSISEDNSVKEISFSTSHKGRWDTPIDINQNPDYKSMHNRAKIMYLKLKAEK